MHKWEVGGLATFKTRSGYVAEKYRKSEYAGDIFNWD